VFPCRNKAPLTPNGFHDATTDLAIIKLWYKRWPDADVAIPTGQASGRIVLDLDNRTGEHEGRRSLAALEAEHGQLPDTPEVITPSGGAHLVFSAPPGVRIPCSAGKLAEGVDIRADGGYVLIPGSRGYQWDGAHDPRDVPLADVPDWLLQKILASGRNGTPTRATGPDGLETITKGKRNSTMLSHLGRLRNLGYVEEELHGFARVINEVRCEPPMADEEVHTIVRSACGYERGHFEMGPDITEVEERAQRSATLQSATVRALAHSRARKLTPVAVRLAAAIAQRKEQSRPPDTDDGLYYISKDTIGGHEWGTDNWEIKEATVRNHAEELRGYAQHIPGFRAGKRPINFPKKRVDADGVIVTNPETGEPEMVDRYEMTWCYGFDGDPAHLVDALPTLPYPEDGRGKRCGKCGAEKKTKTVEFCPACETVEVVQKPETLDSMRGVKFTPTPPAADLETGGYTLTPIVDTDGSIPMGVSTYPPAPPSAWDAIYERAEQSTPKLGAPVDPGISPETEDLGGVIEALLHGPYALGRSTAQLAGDTGDTLEDCEQAVTFLIRQGRAHRYSGGLIVATVDPVPARTSTNHPDVIGTSTSGKQRQVPKEGN
jgi:hypothetical protein